ncbi:MAG: phosphotransferase [Opitutaceae bacterium]|nr:phosphotransferase [Opitutaceae bacterium]MBP9912865.1 phosphotransferase [Opitutaceae bacterium]
MRSPTAQDAVAAVENALHVRAIDARRFSTGLCHFVYEVTLEKGGSVVVRLAKADTAPLLAGGVYWHAQLMPLGLPLPAQLHTHLAGPMPHTILERLPGDDLGAVYAQLSDVAKKTIATAVSAAQSRAAQLPEAIGFGHALSYDDPALRQRRSWRQVLDGLMLRSRHRMHAVGAVNPGVVDRVAHSLDRFDSYFDQVRPVAFLDDTTTKNVLIHEGRLSGIVDVDEICFGDPLLTVGLTQMALLARRLDTHYIEHWLDCLSATEEMRAVTNAYAAVFCADFLSEQGHAFNRESTTVDAAAIAFLLETLETLLANASS